MSHIFQYKISFLLHFTIWKLSSHFSWMIRYLNEQRTEDAYGEKFFSFPLSLFLRLAVCLVFSFFFAPISLQSLKFSVGRTSVSFFHVIAFRPRRNSPHRQIKLESLTRHAGNRRIYLYLRLVRLGNSWIFLKFLRPSRSLLLNDIRQCHIFD